MSTSTAAAITTTAATPAAMPHRRPVRRINPPQGVGAQQGARVAWVSR